MTEPKPRPPFPGDWYPDMADRGMSLWKIRMRYDFRDPKRRLHVMSYEQLTPTVLVAYEPIRDTSDGGGPYVQLDGWIVAKTPAQAIETMVANVLFARAEEA
jgi:hypothetical protein